MHRLQRAAFQRSLEQSRIELRCDLFHVVDNNQGLGTWQLLKHPVVAAHGIGIESLMHHLREMEQYGFTCVKTYGRGKDLRRWVYTGDHRLDPQDFRFFGEGREIHDKRLNIKRMAPKARSVDKMLYITAFGGKLLRSPGQYPLCPSSAALLDRLFGVPNPLAL